MQDEPQADGGPEQPPPDTNDAAPEPQPEPSRAIELRAPAAELAQAGAYINGQTPQEIIQTAKAIADPLKQLIEGAGLSVHVGGRRKHVEIGGWQALGAMLGALGGQPLHAETVWTRRVLDPDGQPARTTYTALVKRYYSKKEGGGIKSETTYDVDGFSYEAKVEVRTAAGVLVGSAEGQCGRDEETWNDRQDFALRSMAETRAESRAYRRAVGWLVNLAGYNPTPAEEMGGGANGQHEAGEPELPAWAKPTTDPARKRLALDALTFILDPQQEDVDPDAEVTPKKLATALLQLVGRQFGGIPECLISALSWTAANLRDAINGQIPEVIAKAPKPKPKPEPKPAPAPKPAPEPEPQRQGFDPQRFANAATGRAPDAPPPSAAPPPPHAQDQTAAAIAQEPQERAPGPIARAKAEAEANGETLEEYFARTTEARLGHDARVQAEDVITDAEVVEEPPKQNPTPPEAQYGESPAQHLARLRQHGCICSCPFPVNGHPAANDPKCPIDHDPIKF